jgi:hypothetical protein
MYVDYCGLKKITIKNHYPLLLISNFLEQINQAKIFTNFDLRGAYNLVDIKKTSDKWKTIFHTRYGHFKYNVMPFGLTNALVSFKHMMNDIFKEFVDDFVVIYLDDILIFSKTSKEHENHVHLVFNKIWEKRLCVKLGFFLSSIKSRIIGLHHL